MKCGRAQAAHTIMNLLCHSKFNFNLPSQFSENEYASMYPWLLGRRLIQASWMILKAVTKLTLHQASSIIWNKSGVRDKMLCAVSVKCDLEILAWSYCRDAIDSRTFVVKWLSDVFFFLLVTCRFRVFYRQSSLCDLHYFRLWNRSIMNFFFLFWILCDVYSYQIWIYWCIPNLRLSQNQFSDESKQSDYAKKTTIFQFTRSEPTSCPLNLL